MGNAILDCPHCHAHELAMKVFATHKPPPALQVNEPKHFVVGAAICGNCGRPLALRLYPDQNLANELGAIGTYADNMVKNATGTPAQYHLQVVIDPTPDGPHDLPDHLSDAVKKALQQAEHNFGIEGSEEAAAMMYRRTLEVALKEEYPLLKREDLKPKIARLVAENRLPEAMGDWANEVRIVGNDGAHDIDGVTRKDLEAARAFTDAFLRYFITLPKEVALRRGGP